MSAGIAARACATSEKGSLGNIVCPYHSWTYNLTGDLMFAEHMGDQFDRCKHSLKRFTWRISRA